MCSSALNECLSLWYDSTLFCVCSEETVDTLSAVTETARRSTSLQYAVHVTSGPGGVFQNKQSDSQINRAVDTNIGPFISKC
jgi:hypothetical protein